ncbi:hypothetical protein Tco_0846389 [Tanacetum coccineum]
MSGIVTKYRVGRVIVIRSPEVALVVHVADGKGIHVDPAKIEAIKKWEKITIDLVTKLPRTSRWHDSIWVIVDRINEVCTLPSDPRRLQVE